MKIRQQYNEDVLRSDKEANGGRMYQQCAISVMDTISDPDISFDQNGVSNYFHDYQQAKKTSVFEGEKGKQKFDDITRIIKNDSKSEYDCILGVSGGVDSTYLAYLAKQCDLRVLCVHFDNGWNSELAVVNIQNIVEKCGFDLHTYVMDWEEFRDVQRAYFKANVIDIEAVTDIAIFSALDMICHRYGIKHILDGRNVATEHTLPKSWRCKDSANLRDIHRQFGTTHLKKYPLLGPVRGRIRRKFRATKSWPLLNYVDYDKTRTKEIITAELKWKDYGGKHYESVFTRFYQGYILPEKFHVDKRKAHLSDLIFSGQITKNEALEQLRKPIYPLGLLEQDYDFVLKKLGFSSNEFEAYLNAPSVPHSNYHVNRTIFDEFPILKPFRFLKRSSHF